MSVMFVVSRDLVDCPMVSLFLDHERWVPAKRAEIGYSVLVFSALRSDGPL